MTGDMRDRNQIVPNELLPSPAIHRFALPFGKQRTKCHAPSTSRFKYCGKQRDRTDDMAAVGRATGFVCANLAPAQPVSEQLLKRCDLIVVNEVEAAFYGDLLHRGGGRVVITQGARGAEMYHRGVKMAWATPPSVVAIDATGAGDAFVGAIVVALLDGMEPRDALDFACAAGALAATRAGAQPSLPTRDEVEGLLAG